MTGNVRDKRHSEYTDFKQLMEFCQSYLSLVSLVAENILLFIVLLILLLQSMLLLMFTEYANISVYSVWLLIDKYRRPIFINYF